MSPASRRRVMLLVVVLIAATVLYVAAQGTSGGGSGGALEQQSPQPVSRNRRRFSPTRAPRIEDVDDPEELYAAAAAASETHRRANRTAQLVDNVPMQSSRFLEEEGGLLFLQAPSGRQVVGPITADGMLAVPHGTKRVIIEVGTNRFPEYLAYVKRNPDVFYIMVEPLTVEAARTACETIGRRCVLFPSAIFNREDTTVFNVALVDTCSSLIASKAGRCAKSVNQVHVALLKLDTIISRVPRHLYIDVVALDCQGVDLLAAASLDVQLPRVAHVIVECQDLPLGHKLMLSPHSYSCGQAFSCIQQYWRGWQPGSCYQNIGVREWNCVFVNTAHMLFGVIPVAIPLAGNTKRPPKTLMFDETCPEEFVRPQPLKGATPLSTWVNPDMAAPNSPVCDEAFIFAGLGPRTSVPRGVCASWTSVCGVVERAVESLVRGHQTCGFLINFAERVIGVHANDTITADSVEERESTGSIPTCFSHPVRACLNYHASPSRISVDEWNDIVRATNFGTLACENDVDILARKYLAPHINTAGVLNDTAAAAALDCTSQQYHLGRKLNELFVAIDVRNEAPCWRLIAPLKAAPEVFVNVSLSRYDSRTYGTFAFKNCLKTLSKVRTLAKFESSVRAGELSCEDFYELQSYVSAKARATLTMKVCSPPSKPTNGVDLGV